VPYLLRSQQRQMGIFATRGPRRVNPLGLSLIQLLEVTPEAVLFAGVDVVDGTPVVGLKPYVTRFDRPPGEPPCGWFDGLDISDYGLGAGIWTKDISKAHALAKKLRAGTVWINCYNVFDASLPFGGYKQSGWGREIGHEVLNNYTEVKAVTTQL
jgi:hypothetical protein